MASFEQLVFEIIAKDRNASAAFDRFRRSVDDTSGSLDKNTQSLQKNQKAQVDVRGGLIGLGLASSALLSPLAAAGGGFTVFAGLAVPSIAKISKAFTGPGGLQANLGTLDAGQKKVALSVQALGQDYSQLAKQMEPRVFQVFNTGIAEANQLLGPFDQLAIAGGKGVENFLAQFTTGSGLGQFITFLSKEAAPALTLIGQDVTAISHAVFSLLESFGGLGMAELRALTVVLTGVSNSIVWLSQHAPGITSVGIAIGGLALALSKFGLLTSVLRLTGLSTAVSQVALITTEVKGLTLAERGLAASEAAVKAITPFGWALLGAAALGAAAFSLRNVNNGYAQLIGNMTEQDHATGLNVAGYQRLSAALRDTTARIADQQKAGVILSTQTAHLVAENAALSGAAVTASAKARNLKADFASLGAQYGLTSGQAETLIVKSGVLNELLKNNGKITPDVAAKIAAWAKTENTATGQTNTMAIAVKTLTDAMNKNVTTVLTLQGDELAWRSAMQQATAQLASNSAGLKGNSANAIANKQSVLAATNAAIAFAKEQLTEKTNLSGASSEVQAQIKWLRGLHDQSGFTKEEIKALVSWLRQIKSEQATIHVSGSGSWNVLPSGKHIPVPGGVAARGLFINSGTPGVDDQLIAAQRGELVVPTDIVRSGAVDHLRGQIPGFASGGVVGSFADGTKGLTRWLSNENLATLRAMEQSVATTILAGIRQGFGGFGGGGGPGGPVEAVARALFPWPASQWPAFNYVEMREAGYNLNARNPTSGAFGVAQFINGPSEYFQWGGNPFTAAGQFTGMFNYIASRYVTPAAAAQHELAFNWYDSGQNYLPPGLSLAMNGTGRPERVGGGGDIIINGPITVYANDEGDLVRKLQKYAERNGPIRLKVRS